MIGSVGGVRRSDSSGLPGQIPNGWSPKGWSPNGLKLFFGVVISFVPGSASCLSGKVGVAIMDGKKAMKMRRMSIPGIEGWIIYCGICKNGTRIFFK